MDVLLFAVEDVIHIKGLGTVLFPGISYSYSGPQLQNGQSLTVLCPDGQEIKTNIKSVANIRPLKSLPFVLPKNIKAEEIPIGSQVWISNVISIVE
jgi:hypothetical protein